MAIELEQRPGVPPGVAHLLKVMKCCKAETVVALRVEDPKRGGDWEASI